MCFFIINIEGGGSLLIFLDVELNGMVWCGVGLYSGFEGKCVDEEFECECVFGRWRIWVCLSLG